MKVRLRDIPQDGLEYSASALPADLDLSEDFVDPDKPVVVSGRLTKVDDFVLADLDIVYTADSICARCLEPLSSQAKSSCSMEIETRPGDEFVDVGELVREEILMGNNARLLCREDCKGICQQCGAYLNEEPCECHKDNKGE